MPAVQSKTGDRPEVTRAKAAVAARSLVRSAAAKKSPGVGSVDIAAVCMAGTVG